MEKIIQKDILIIYSEGKNLKYPVYVEKLSKNGFHNSLLINLI
jgi:hypothetical protein